MRVLITGNQGYIGPVMSRVLRDSGHDVHGLDSGLFEGCVLEPDAEAAPTLQRDIRDVTASELRGFDAIVHLANLSNDPLGTLDSQLTHDINVEATIRLARLAREAGVARFVNSSSCSVYGDAVEPWVDEHTEPRPVTAYGHSKLAAEQGLAELADDRFCVTSLRNATAFGYSPRLRLDLVVNDLVASAVQFHEVRLASDGSAWRPLVHIRDIARAFALTLEAVPAVVNQQVFNVGADTQNFRILEVAHAVVAEIQGAELAIRPDAPTDRRSYRVRFERIRQLLPTFACVHGLEYGVRELRAAFLRVGLTAPERFVRLVQLEQLKARGGIGPDLRVVAVARR
jgi:nucleoside-diphosphate-sugar epimerase